MRLALALLAVPAAAHAAPRRVLVLPVEAIGADAERGGRVREAVAAALRARADLRLVDPTADLPRGCAAEDACALDAGRAAGADAVLGVSVAGLGDTHLVHARLYHVATAAPGRELRESVVGGERALLARVAGMARALLPPPAPPSRGPPWWVVAAAGVAVVGAAIALPLALRGDEEGDTIQRRALP